MASNKAFLLLALLVALVLVVAASTDLAPTSTVKENGKASDDAKQVPVPNLTVCHSSPCCYFHQGCICNPPSLCHTCCSDAGEAVVDSAEP